MCVPSDIGEVDFEGATAEIAQLPPGGVRRVRVRLDVRNISTSEAEA